VQQKYHRESSVFASELSALKSGQDTAWASLYLELVGPITGYLASRGVSEAEDLASEVFLQLARDIHRFEGDRESFRSWAYVIAHRRMIDWRRARVRRPVAVSDTVADAPGGDVEEEALEKLQTDWINEILAVLTEDQRDVLALRVLADLNLEQTAEVTGKSVGAVKALQHRALHTVRDALVNGSVSL
jgi:RNA polymerase sigma factor (sigma-70 family)